MSRLQELLCFEWSRTEEENDELLKIIEQEMIVDGEIIGIDQSGYIIQWNAELNEPYTPGETLDEFGRTNLTNAEAQRLMVK